MRHAGRALGGIVLLGAALSGFGWMARLLAPPPDPSAPHVPAAAPATNTPAWQPRPCWGELPSERARCGVVEVPLGAAGRALGKLAVVRVVAEESRAVPLLFLGGGPGQAVIGRLTGPLAGWLPLARHRDLLFVDPRGTGFSQPSLQCKKKGSLKEALAACYEEHSIEFDPAEFTTARSVSDLEAVRQALGYEQWDVFGTSYGTRLALTMLRDTPGSVRAVVLDSPVPLQVDLIAQLGPNAYRALAALARACQGQVACAQAYPDLLEQLEHVVRALGQQPIRVERGWLDADRFVRALFGFLYTEAASAYVPQVIHGAARGHFDVFSRLEEGLSGDELALGVHLSVQCAEEVPFTTQKAVAAADAEVPADLRALLSGRSYLEDCALWPVRAAPPVENEPVHTAHPALIFVGELDPVTPPAYGELVHAHLSGSRLAQVRGAAHAVGLTSCGIELVEAFLDEPMQPLGLRCFGSGEGDSLPLGGYKEIGQPLAFRTEAPTEQELEAVLGAM